MSLAKLPIAVGLAILGTFAAQSALAQNVSVSINQPGVYGRVDIGEPVPQRAWVDPRPVVVRPAQFSQQRQPIYLYVPPNHSANWGRYCDRYSACAQPVVFVQDSWVRDRDTQSRYGRHRDRHDNGRHARGRDRDGDGVRNSRDRDRDGDGIRNSRDRAPNNPYRY